MLSDNEFSIESSSSVVRDQPTRSYSAEFKLSDEFLNIDPFFKGRKLWFMISYYLLNVSSAPINV